MANLDEHLRARIRHHLGYLQTEPSSSIALGFPAASEAGFLVERAMSNVLREAVQIIQRSVAELDDIENQMSEARKRLKAISIGNLRLRGSNNEKTEIDLLQREYDRWQKKLADDLGVTPNPFATQGGEAPFNIPVVVG